jgi:effector-binding domain-containing protein
MKAIFIFFILVFSSALRASVGTDNNCGQLPETGSSNVTDTIPRVWIEKKVLPAMKLLYILDTANRGYELPRKISRDYGDIFLFAGRQNLDMGRKMLFYHTKGYPCIFEAAVEVNEFPGQLKYNIQSRTAGGSEAIVAHYNGAYSQIGLAYTAINHWLAANKKTAKGLYFEIQLSDPATVTNNSKLRTDVYQQYE